MQKLNTMFINNQPLRWSDTFGLLDSLSSFQDGSDCTNEVFVPGPMMSQMEAEQILAAEGIIPQEPLTKNSKDRVFLPANCNILNTMPNSIPNAMPNSIPNAMPAEKKKSIKKPRCPHTKFTKTGTWSDDEHELFLVGLKKFGAGKWKSISDFMKTRTRIQVASHWQKWKKKSSEDHDEFDH